MTNTPVFNVVVERVERRLITVAVPAESADHAPMHARVRASMGAASLFDDATATVSYTERDVFPANDAARRMLPDDSIVYALCRDCDRHVGDCDCETSDGWPPRVGLCSVCNTPAAITAAVDAEVPFVCDDCQVLSVECSVPRAAESADVRRDARRGLATHCSA